MSTYPKIKTSFQTVSEKIAIPLMCAITAALAAGELDLKFAWPVLNGTGSILKFISCSLPLLVFASLIITLSAQAIYHLAIATAKRFKKSPKIFIPALFFAILLPGIIFLSINLFSGGTMSRLALKWLWFALTIVTLSLFVMASSLIAVWIMGLYPFKPKSLTFSVISAIGLLLISIMFWWMDAFLYKRLYWYLHVILSLLTIGGLSIGIWIVLMRHLKIPAYITLGTLFLFAIIATVAVIYPPGQIV
jgi:hypothetical protein